VGTRDRDGCAEHPLFRAAAGSELALSALEVPPGTSLVLGDAADDTMVFVVGGTGTVVRGADELAVGPGSTALLLSGETGTVVAGAEPLDLVCATVGPQCDLHAPMGPASPLERLDEIEPGKATGARSFQVLYDATNGSTRATLFVGHIPPGKAPWHYHLYDEIVWVLGGEGRLHIGDAIEPLAPGCAFRLHPRETHIVENTSPDRELSVLGLFTPAGSPSAAYLMPGDFAEYAATRT